ncbi:hypothetical protein D3C75_467150 [compost metagenome]
MLAKRKFSTYFPFAPPTRIDDDAAALKNVVLKVLTYDRCVDPYLELQRDWSIRDVIDWRRF